MNLNVKLLNSGISRFYKVNEELEKSKSSLHRIIIIYNVIHAELSFAHVLLNMTAFRLEWHTLVVLALTKRD